MSLFMVSHVGDMLGFLGVFIFKPIQKKNKTISIGVFGSGLLKTDQIRSDFGSFF